MNTLSRAQSQNSVANPKISKKFSKKELKTTLNNPKSSPASPPPGQTRKLPLTKLLWSDHPDNPIIRPPFPDWILADPHVIPGPKSPDGKWHLFAHGVFGIYHYLSYDGYRWKKAGGILKSLSLRPYLYQKSKTYYLLYEKIIPPYRLPFYNSHLEMISSTDLKKWSRPTILIKPTLDWHRTKNKIGNIGNASITRTKEGFRLYYSSGLISFSDVVHCEPCYQGVAFAKRINGPYKLKETPIAKRKETRQSFRSAIRIIQKSRLFVALQTVIKTNPITLLSTAALHLSYSKDGIKWRTKKRPIISPKKGWNKTHVYIGSFVKTSNGQKRIYYNAREDRGFLNKESIGLMEAK